MRITPSPASSRSASNDFSPGSTIRFVGISDTALPDLKPLPVEVFPALLADLRSYKAVAKTPLSIMAFAVVRTPSSSNGIFVRALSYMGSSLTVNTEEAIVSPSLSARSDRPLCIVVARKFPKNTIKNCWNASLLRTTL